MFARIVKGFSFFQIIILVLCGYVSALENVTTVSLVEQSGYPIEEHEIITEDGYVLVAHRIPYSPTNETQVKPRPVAILQHGFIACSTDWVVAGPGKGLAYLLADKGFDVWMLNTRGNYYSNRNTNLSEYSFKFWDYSFHDIAVYDLPANFHYIRNLTGVQKFQYFGHSQGTTVFVVLCCSLPEYNDWFISVHLLAPVVFIQNAKSTALVTLGPVFGQPEDALSSYPFNLGYTMELFHITVEYLCNDDSIFQTYCLDFIYSMVGESDYFNATLIPFLTLIYPAGSSDKPGIHYFQTYVSGQFRQFDYGLRNFQHYQSYEPPEYDLNKVVTPTYLYYSQNDYLSSELDVLRLADTLPETTVKGVYKVIPKYWNHLDFLYGIDIDKYVNAQVLKDLDKYL